MSSLGCVSAFAPHLGASSLTIDASQSFFATSIPRLSSLLTLRNSLLSSPSAPTRGTTSLDLLTKLILSHGKLYRLLFSHNPAAFLAMNVSAELMSTYYSTITSACTAPSSSTSEAISSEPTSLYPTLLIVQSLLLLKQCLGDWASSSPIPVDPAFVRQFAELIVTRLLPLRREDLEKWEEEPEEWMNEEESERWEFELRVSCCERQTNAEGGANPVADQQPCAEHVLQSLLNHYKSDLGPSMSSLLQQASGSSRSP